MTLADMERAALIDAIRTQGSIAGAARHLGIGRATAFRMVNKYGLRDEDLGYAPEAAEAAEVVETPPPTKPEAPPVDPLFGNWKP